jgi:hypothetical protein
MPSSDLQSIELLQDKQNTRTLTLRLQTKKALSARLSYRLWLHALTANNSEVKRVYIRFQDGAWKATMHSADVQDITVRPVTRGFELDVPRGVATSYLISAESFLRNTRLDGTGTGTLRLPAVKSAVPHTPLHTPPHAPLVN